ncbi:MAG TPA: ParB N-terminal domain-containing protein [Syntrophorhabdaceae bacterium]|jgi:hypothetical protein
MAYLATIALERIDVDDRRFCISYPMEPGPLLPSIDLVGIVEPLLLLEGSPFVIISGHKRAEAALRLGLTEVPAFVESGLEEKGALIRAIHANAGRGLNVVEKAIALDKMAAAGFSSEETFGTMEVLGCSPHEKVLSTFLALARAGDPFKAFIHTNGLSLRNIEDLLKFNEAERKELLALLSPLHVTEGYLRDLLRLIALMKVKEGRIDFVALGGTENAGDLRAKLKQRTHPLLTSMEARLEEVKVRMALPPNIDIRVDPFFEKEYIDIGIRTRDIEDLEKALEKLRRTLDNGSIGSILELTRG